MKRNPRKVRWTKAFRKAAGKEMTVDPSLEFEKRRNAPVRYNRDLVEATTSAMERIAEIKSRREKAFWKARMNAQKPTTLYSDALEVSRSSHVLGHNPPETALKALASAEKVIASRKAAKEERIQSYLAKVNNQKGKSKEVVMEPKMTELSHEEDEKVEEDVTMDLSQIISDALVISGNEIEQKKKEKTSPKTVSKKSKKKQLLKTSLIASGGRGMGMELD